MEMLEPGAAVPKKWKRDFKDDRSHNSKWRTEAKEAFSFLAGNQWSQEDRAKLNAELRPVITFDRSSVIIDAISGNEIQSRQQVQYLPRSEGDAIVNELYTSAAHWFDQESEAPDEDSDAFIDCLMTGVGATETRMDFDENPEGDPAVDRFDPTELAWDKSCTKMNLRGARRMSRLRGFTRADIREKWPNIDPKDANVYDWYNAEGTMPNGDIHSNDPEDRYNSIDVEMEDDDDFMDGDGDDSDDNKMYYVAHLQYWVYEDFYMVADPLTNQTVELGEEQFQKLNKAFKGGLEHVKMRRRKYYQCFFGRVVLEHFESPYDKGFTWNVITGKRDRKTNLFYGLYRTLKDPQQWANKWLSQILHIINSNAKGGAFFETGAFPNQEEAEEMWADPTALIEVRQGALVSGKIKEREVGQYPQGFHVLMEFAGNAVRETLGVSLEFLGQREAIQPGVLEHQRRQAGMTVLAPIFNSMRRYRKARGRVMLHYIVNFLSDGRLIRIAGEENEKYVPLIKQADVKYDIIVDDAPTSPNQKEAVWGALMQILPGVKDIIPPKVLLQLLDYSPIPATVVEKIKKVATETSPEEKQASQIAARQALAEALETEASAELKKAQAYKAQAEALRASQPEGQPMDEIEQLERTAVAVDKIAMAKLRDANRLKIMDDMSRVTPASVALIQAKTVGEFSNIDNANVKTDAEVEAILARAQKDTGEFWGTTRKVPSEIDLTRAQAEDVRRPEPKGDD